MFELSRMHILNVFANLVFSLNGHQYCDIATGNETITHYAYGYISFSSIYKEFLMH